MHDLADRLRSDPAEKRYSPAECLGCDVKPVTGRPNPKLISTSYVEPPHLTMQDEVFGMARMYEIRTDENPLQVRIFRDIEEARAWLGLPPSS